MWSFQNCKTGTVELFWAMIFFFLQICKMAKLPRSFFGRFWQADIRVARTKQGHMTWHIVPLWRSVRLDHSLLTGPLVRKEWLQWPKNILHLATFALKNQISMPDSLWSRKTFEAESVPRTYVWYLNAYFVRLHPFGTQSRGVFRNNRLWFA